MKKLIQMSTIILTFIFAGVVIAQTTETQQVKKELSPLGIWWTNDQQAKVQLYDNGSSVMEGKIIWLKEPDENGKPKVDILNPDKTLRARPILNLIFLTGFKKEKGTDKWIDGAIYDAQSGKTYAAWIKAIDEKNLELRGYVGVSLFGRTEKWTRVSP